MLFFSLKMQYRFKITQEFISRFYFRSIGHEFHFQALYLSSEKLYFIIFSLCFCSLSNILFLRGWSCQKFYWFVDTLSCVSWAHAFCVTLTRTPKYMIKTSRLSNFETFRLNLIKGIHPTKTEVVDERCGRRKSICTQFYRILRLTVAMSRPI